MIPRNLVVLLAAALVSACAITPDQHAGAPGQPYTCLNYAIPLELAPPSNGLTGDPFIEEIEQTLSNAALTSAGEPISESMLFLSGGSQHGAFGAGFLNRWSEARGGLPRFRIVTGISTGALQSTLAFIGEPQEIVDRYAIRSESELLESITTAHMDGSTTEGLRAAATILRKGAIAELNPLRRQLLGNGAQDNSAILNDSRLRRVAREVREGRSLFAGAVELDSGKAVAFNLGAMAVAYASAAGPQQETLRNCYAEALIASSSVPIAAQPSFIEGRMFIDGGARFGVLPAKLVQLAEQLRKKNPKGSEPADRPNLYVLVNGTLEIPTKCDLEECGSSEPEISFPPSGTIRRHLDWRFTNLAFRSLSILINQSYASSVELARRDAEWCRREPLISAARAMGAKTDGCAKDDATTGMKIHFVRILPTDAESERYTFGVNRLRTPVNGDMPFENGERTCDAWSKLDEARETPRPHEFHPRYMRCLIRYGSNIADELKWWELEPRRLAVLQ